MFWAIPTKYDFVTLETRHRNLFIKDNPLFSDIYDSTVIIESKKGSGEFHHQSGAMTVSQLQTEYRIFKLKEDFPKVILFLDTTLKSAENIEYSGKSMREYVQRAFQICKSHSDNFERTMEAIL